MHPLKQNDVGINSRKAYLCLAHRSVKLLNVFLWYNYIHSHNRYKYIRRIHIICIYIFLNVQFTLSSFTSNQWYRHLLSKRLQLVTLPFQSHVCLSMSNAKPDGQVICFIPALVHLKEKMRSCNFYVKKKKSNTLSHQNSFHFFFFTPFSWWNAENQLILAKNKQMQCT